MLLLQVLPRDVPVLTRLGRLRGSKVRGAHCSLALYCWHLLSFSVGSFPLRRLGPFLMYVFWVPRRHRGRRGSLFLPPQEQPPLRRFLADRSCGYRLTPSGLPLRGPQARSSCTGHRLTQCPWQPSGGFFSTPSLRHSGGLLCPFVTCGVSLARRLGPLLRDLLGPVGGCRRALSVTSLSWGRTSIKLRRRQRLLGPSGGFLREVSGDYKTPR